MTQPEPIAIVGISAIMPDAPTAQDFWSNIRGGRYSISDVPVGPLGPGAVLRRRPPRSEDKTYSRIGGWVREFPWEPMAWKLPIPPSVAAHFDEGQMWSVERRALGPARCRWPNWDVDSDRVGVILGSALGGDKYVRTTLRIAYPEFDRELSLSPSFAALPAEVQAAIRAEARERFVSDLPTITEDTMPGELSNIMAGRVAALFNLRGPELHHGCRLRLGAGRHERGDRGPAGPSLSTPASPGASTTTWARARSCASARSAPCRPPARGRSTPAPTAS